MRIFVSSSSVSVKIMFLPMAFSITFWISSARSGFSRFSSATWICLVVKNPEKKMRYTTRIIPARTVITENALRIFLLMGRSLFGICGDVAPLYEGSCLGLLP